MKKSNKEILATMIGIDASLIKDNLSVGGSLDLRGTSITELPDNLSVGDSLDLRGTSITELPDNLSVVGSLYLEGTSITELPDNLSVVGSLYLDPEKQTSISAYRKNCGSSNRTIYAVFISGEFKIRAGCFFGSFDAFCKAVRKDYKGLSADNYIKKAQECVDELSKKLSK